MKKFLLIALAFSGLNVFAGGTLSLKPITNDPNCYGGNTGAIILNVNGGTTPYSYSWSNNLPNINTPAQSGLTAGTYSVTVTDHVGATASYMMVIGQPDALSLVTSAQNVSAHGATDGCVSINVSGGTPDYSFHWSNNANIQNPCGLSAGTYYVTVTDAFGCTATASKTIAQPATGVHSGNNNNNQTHSLGSNSGTQNSQLSTPGNESEAALGQTTNVTVFPNPANDVLTINIDAAVTSEITIYNALGQVILKRVTEGVETKLDVSNLVKGNYIASIKNENGTTSKMFTVIK